MVRPKRRPRRGNVKQAKRTRRQRGGGYYGRSALGVSPGGKGDAFTNAGGAQQAVEDYDPAVATELTKITPGVGVYESPINRQKLGKFDNVILSGKSLAGIAGNRILKAWNNAAAEAPPPIVAGMPNEANLRLRWKEHTLALWAIKTYIKDLGGIEAAAQSTQAQRRAAFDRVNEEYQARQPRTKGFFGSRRELGAEEGRGGIMDGAVADMVYCARPSMISGAAKMIASLYCHMGREGRRTQPGQYNAGNPTVSGELGLRAMKRALIILAMGDPNDPKWKNAHASDACIVAAGGKINPTTGMVEAANGAPTYIVPTGPVTGQCKGQDVAIGAAERAAVRESAGAISGSPTVPQAAARAAAAAAQASPASSQTTTAASPDPAAQVTPTPVSGTGLPVVQATPVSDAPVSGTGLPVVQGTPVSGTPPAQQAAQTTQTPGPGAGQVAATSQPPGDPDPQAAAAAVTTQATGDPGSQVPQAAATSQTPAATSQTTGDTVPQAAQVPAQPTGGPVQPDAAAGDSGARPSVSPPPALVSPEGDGGGARASGAIGPAAIGPAAAAQMTQRMSPEGAEQADIQEQLDAL